MGLDDTNGAESVHTIHEDVPACTYRMAFMYEATCHQGRESASVADTSTCAQQRTKTVPSEPSFAAIFGL